MKTRNDQEDKPQLSYQQLIALGVQPKWASLVDVLDFDCFILVWRNIQYTQEMQQLNIPDYRKFRTHLIQAYYAELQDCHYSKSAIAKHIKAVFGS